MPSLLGEEADPCSNDCEAAQRRQANPMWSYPRIAKELREVGIM
jgi:hypothetical protein